MYQRQNYHITQHMNRLESIPEAKENDDYSWFPLEKPVGDLDRTIFGGPSNHRANLRTRTLFEPSLITDWSQMNVDTNPVRENPAPVPDQDVENEHQARVIEQVMNQRGLDGTNRFSSSSNFDRPIPEIRTNGTRKPMEIHPFQDRILPILPEQKTRTYFETQNIVQNGHDPNGGTHFRDIMSTNLSKQETIMDMSLYGRHTNSLALPAPRSEHVETVRKNVLTKSLGGIIQRFKPNPNRPPKHSKRMESVGTSSDRRLPVIQLPPRNEFGGGASVTKTMLPSVLPTRTKSKKVIHLPPRNEFSGGANVTKTMLPPVLPSGTKFTKKIVQLPVFYHTQYQSDSMAGQSNHKMKHATKYLGLTRHSEKYPLQLPKTNRTTDITSALFKPQIGNVVEGKPNKLLRIFQGKAPLKPTHSEIKATGVYKGETVQPNNDRKNIRDYSNVKPRGNQDAKSIHAPRELTQYATKPKFLQEHTHPERFRSEALPNGIVAPPIKPEFIELKQDPLQVDPRYNSTIRGSATNIREQEHAFHPDSEDMLAISAPRENMRSESAAGPLVFDGHHQVYLKDDVRENNRSEQNRNQVKNVAYTPRLSVLQPQQTKVHNQL